MRNKLRLLPIVTIVVLTLCCVYVINHARASEDPPVIGPFTEIVLPLDDLPALNEKLAYNPALDQPYTEVVEVSEYSEENDYYISWRETAYFERGSTLQILYVLDDPRPVPEARFAHYSSASESVIPPNNYNPKTVNVYVRVRAPEDKSVHDPIFAGYYEDSPLGSTPALYVSADVSSAYPNRGFPDLVSCAMPEYANGTEPYGLPGDIEGGLAVGKDGLYDPKAYAPPQPWYFGENQMLEPGEVREGWISCMAPDVPLEDILIYSGYWYTPEPEIRFEGFGFQWLFAENIYLHDPDFSSLEKIGLNASDLPVTLEECTASDHCLTLESRTAVISSEAWGECTERAKEAGLEQGLCSYLNDPGCPTETLNAAVFYTETFEEATRDTPLAWSYDKVKPVPEDGIRLDDVSLTFINEEGKKKAAQGSVIFRDPMIGRSNIGFYYNGFVSRVEVEPAELSEEDLQGYTLSEVGAYVYVSVEHEDTFISWDTHTDRNLPVIEDLVQPDNPYVGFIFIHSNETSFGWADNRNTQGSSLPNITLMRIHPLQENADPSPRTRDIYLVKVGNIYNPVHESSTTMCDFVECLDIKDPKDERALFRTVPIFCAGEWANNFIIDDLDIQITEYIMEPYGVKGFHSTPKLHQISGFSDKYDRTWLYGGRIMGGLTPWWMNQVNKCGDTLYGQILDMNTRLNIGDQALTLPYFQEFDQGFFVSLFRYSQDSGWIGGIVDEKLLIFGIVRERSYDGENTGYLFLDEGPIWTTNCQRNLLPPHADQEQYAPSEVGVLISSEGNQHEMTAMMPGMEYPVSKPIVSGEILSLGEEGTPLAGYAIAPKEVRLIPGKYNEPVVYAVSEDQLYPATKTVNFNNEIFFDRVGAIVIPPDSTLVAIKFDADLLAEEDPPQCKLDGGDFQLSYPGYYPISSTPPYGLVGGWSCRGEDYKSWLYFRFPSLEIEMENMLLTAHGTSRETWNFWKLTEE